MDPILPSVFDRLTDPSLAGGPHRYTLTRAAKRVEEDLVDLMTAKRPASGTYDGLPEVERSIVNFGLPDVSHGILESPDLRMAYCDAVREAIERFEPRLTDVVVAIPSSSDNLRGDDVNPGTLPFRIHARLNLYPDTVEEVVFHSEFNLNTGEHRVRLSEDA